MIPAGTKLAKYQKRSGKRLKKRVRQKNKADCFTREIGTNSLYRNVFSY
jgi:hypothetical protein